jgi:hypothetical protein
MTEAGNTGAPRERRDGKTSPFFRATPEQVKALRMLTLLLISIIFWPTIQWVASAIVRRNPVHTDQVEAVIRRRWIATEDGSIVQAWIPCLTIFCSSPRSSIMIQVGVPLAGKEDAWLRRAELVLREKEFSIPSKRSFRSPTGNIQCIESISQRRRGVVDSTCFESESGFEASFEGAISELGDFYSIVASAKVVKKK